MQEKVNNCTTNEEDAVKGFDEVYQEFEDIIQNKKSDIIQLAYIFGKVKYFSGAAFNGITFKSLKKRAIFQNGFEI